MRIEKPEVAALMAEYDYRLTAGAHRNSASALCRNGQVSWEIVREEHRMHIVVAKRFGQISSSDRLRFCVLLLSA